MPAYFEQGFMVRQPAWHGLGEVLADYPGRDEAMRLAGHDFVVVEKSVTVPNLAGFERKAEGWKALVKDPGDEILGIVSDSYGVVQNAVPWDIVDAVVAQPEVRYETGGTLKGGSLCWVLAWLDEPVVIPGDDSPILPFLCASWTHDGSGSVRIRSTSVRIVCANTESASEAEGRRLGTDFTFRHTKNVQARIEDAKMAVKGIRLGHEEYVELARELADLPVTDSQRELFVSQFLPMPPEALTSERVKRNVEDARSKVRGLFDGPTIPDAHRNTGYGLHLAGGEYLDHLRGYRSKDTLFGRQLLRDEPAKKKLTTLIREVAAAA